MTPTGPKPPAPLPSRVVLALACEAAGLDLVEAVLRGPGAPGGVHALERRGGEVVFAVDDNLTPVAFVLAAVDIELRRIGARRTTRLLAPLSAASAARIVGAAIREPALDESRIIETYLADTA